MRAEASARLKVAALALVALLLGGLAVAVLARRLSAAAPAQPEPAPLAQRDEALPVVLPPPPPAPVPRAPPRPVEPAPPPEPETEPEPVDVDLAMTASNCAAQLSTRIPAATPQAAQLARLVCAVFAGEASVTDVDFPFVDVGGGSKGCDAEPLDAEYDSAQAFSAFDTRTAARYPAQLPHFMLEGDEVRVGDYDYSRGVTPELTFRLDGQRWRWASQEAPRPECDESGEDPEADPAPDVIE